MVTEYNSAGLREIVVGTNLVILSSFLIKAHERCLGPDAG